MKCPSQSQDPFISPLRGLKTCKVSVEKSDRSAPQMFWDSSSLTSTVRTIRARQLKAATIDDSDQQARQQLIFLSGLPTIQCQDPYKSNQLFLSLPPALSSLFELRRKEVLKVPMETDAFF